MEFAGLDIDRKRWRAVLMERAAKAQLHALLGRLLGSLLHQAVVREHISDAHLAFYLFKTYPLLCHTVYPFRYVLMELDLPSP